MEHIPWNLAQFSDVIMIVQKMHDCHTWDIDIKGIEQVFQ